MPVIWSHRAKHTQRERRKNVVAVVPATHYADCESKNKVAAALMGALWLSHFCGVMGGTADGPQNERGNPDMLLTPRRQLHEEPSHATLAQGTNL